MAEVFKFQPNEYDNNKLLYVWFLLCLPMAADYAMEAFARLRGLPGRRGETDPRMAELRDVMPTLLSLAGAELPPMDGLNLLGEETRAWLHGEHAGGGDDSNHYIVTQTDKYVWFSKSGREQYFHLATDPQEAHDRIADPACQARIADLRAHLIESLRGREEGYVQNERLVPGQKARNVLSTLPRE